MWFFLLMTQNWLPWQRPLRNQKNWTDQENSRKYLTFGEKIVKIGPVVTDIALLIVKKKKLTRAKYIARSARPARQVCRAGYIRPTIILFILSHTRTRSVAADMKHRQYLASQAYTVRLPIGHSLLRSLNQNTSSRLAY